jgi:hypothetical protein
MSQQQYTRLCYQFGGDVFEDLELSPRALPVFKSQSHVLCSTMPDKSTRQFHLSIAHLADSDFFAMNILKTSSVLPDVHRPSLLALQPELRNMVSKLIFLQNSPFLLYNLRGYHAQNPMKPVRDIDSRR